MKVKKLISGLTSAALSLTAFAGLGTAPQNPVTAQAAGGNWKFDLGGSGAASGYTGVSAKAMYQMFQLKAQVLTLMPFSSTILLQAMYSRWIFLRVHMK